MPLVGRLVRLAQDGAAQTRSGRRGRQGDLRALRELIEPGPKWQLDHRDDGRDWLGPGHASCNARAGWEKMIASNGNRVDLEELPYRWSQRWSDDPPMAPSSFGHEHVIYLGNGEWPLLADVANH
jgi:hypothetical protein